MQVKQLLLSLILLSCAQLALANPELEGVTAGKVEVHATDSHVQINQQSSHAILSWHSFNIAPTESVHFQQPPNGIALNRIDPGQGASEIAGRLSATGRIILVNPAGVHFQSTARVDVAGLVATTANISDKNFLANNFHFEDNSGRNGSVTNAGKINAAEHGFAAFIAPHVENTGEITAHLGQIIEFSSSKFILQFGHNDLVHFVIDESAMKQAVRENHFIPETNRVAVKAAAAKNVLDKVIHVPEGHEARSAYVQDGKIILSAAHEAPVKSDVAVSSPKAKPALSRSVSNVSDHSDSDFVLVAKEDDSPRAKTPTLPQPAAWVTVDDVSSPSAIRFGDENGASLSPSAGRWHPTDLLVLSAHDGEDFPSPKSTRSSDSDNSFLTMSFTEMAEHLSVSDLSSPKNGQLSVEVHAEPVSPMLAVSPTAASEMGDDWAYAANLSDAYDSDLDEFITPRADKIYKIKMARNLFEVLPSVDDSLPATPVAVSAKASVPYMAPPVVSIVQQLKVHVISRPHSIVASVGLPIANAPSPIAPAMKLSVDVSSVLHTKDLMTEASISNYPLSSAIQHLYMMMTPLALEHWEGNYQGRFDRLVKVI